MTQAEIGQKYGITQRTVSSIVRGERWIKETLSVDRSSLDQITKYKTKLYQEVSVDMIDIITGNIIKTYNSMSEAIQDGHKSSHISQCCNGKKKTYHGFIWKKHVE